MDDICILMVDDHGLFRESLSRLLQTSPGFRVVGQCSTVSEAVAAFCATPTDVVLLDYDLGEEQGTRLFAELRQRQQAAKVLMVTAGMTDAVTIRIMEEGASGVFLKHSSLDELLAAIQRVANGEVWLDTTALRALSSSRGRNESSERTRPLTLRQSEVMRGILDGLTNKEIAQKLKSSESSVKAVIQELFQKAGVRTRSQLVRIAIEKHSSDWLHTQTAS
jgi:DNA-binding NarL/FixJ family response regulator